MALTAEQWRLYREEIARSRAALPYWREHAPEMFSKITEARVAVADHLTACESLLQEIAESTQWSTEFSRSADPRDWTQSIDYLAVDDWRRQIAALLGPAVSEVTDGE